MNKMSILQAYEFIDLAAQEDRLYHYNGEQAYIRLSNQSNILMILVLTSNNYPFNTLNDGTKYFQQCQDYNFPQSHMLRERGSLADWFKENYQEKVTV